LKSETDFVFDSLMIYPAENDPETDGRPRRINRYSMSSGIGKDTDMQKFMTITEASALLDAGKITPMELVELAIRNTEEYQPVVNAYITFAPDQAREDAKNIYARMQKEGRWSPLTGIPFAVKDLIFAKGLPCTAGSKQMKDFVPGEDAFIVDAMKKAGAILMGKTNTQEWGCGPTGQQSYFGPTKNPWDPTRISGGSSSGSAAALACGMVPAALGSDAGGSIRIPASLCGCVGFKPSFELVSSDGGFHGSIHLGVNGPMANTVEDAALMMDVIAAPHAPVYHKAVKEAAASGSLKGKRFFIPRNLFMDCIHPAVLAVFEDAVRRLKAAGADIVDHDVDWLARIPELSSAITFPEIYYLHKERLESDPEGYQPAIKTRIEKGAAYPAVKYIEALEGRKQFIRYWNDLMKEYDALLMPTLPIAAEPLFTDFIRINGKEEDHSALLVRHTRASNVIGCPSISIPAGFTGDAAPGLPVGIMLMGGIMEDEKLLALSYLSEQSLA